ncbi:MAG TPA: Lrp/AsnC family transcriptional regulator [Ramlibacter sp.]|jgi:DNA-binding Lrp family transcriptional regulator|uniref:Lrp/AsnC family transcriptional regulator n=1 Tax=Ramlibacter sp. TaxID=1917967 RepID=UPI002D730DCE|nr:Lrp/AsnC family transcriptional regulator [Ramlibacter sp.]HZY17731.1 Lrp/AsnC family transcriptional regulator [Ramlibacter sp.]
MDDLDRHDVLLLAELQRDARQTVQQLAAAAGLSSTPCWKRVKEMEASGIIRGYTVLVDRERVGLSLCVLAEVNLTRHNEDDVRRFEQAVAACPPIVGCYATTGQADYVMKVLVPDIKRYESFLHETVFKLPGVTHVRSSVVLREVKAESRLPLDVPRPAPAKRSRAR